MSGAGFPPLIGNIVGRSQSNRATHSFVLPGQAVFALAALSPMNPWFTGITRYPL
jgi:hypothetical protein